MKCTLERELLAFDDVTIIPQFSSIESRKDVDVGVHIDGLHQSIPIISSNMDTVTDAKMAQAMALAGASACLHRFLSIDDNIRMLKDASKLDNRTYLHYPLVSIGVGTQELTRFIELYKAGARTFIIDVAHGASKQVVRQYNIIKEQYKDVFLIVGNFASYSSFEAFKEKVRRPIDGVKLGVGSGAMCSTRIVTGCGIPLLETIMDFQNRNYNGLIIADGGIRNSGDVAKALGAGAHLCMLGSMLAGTEESAGEFIYPEGEKVQPVKLYRGSASKESYISQGKTQTYISPEGESVYVPYKGKVSSILEQIEGGLRSALSYVGAKDLKEFREKVKFARVSKASYIEGTPHGKI